MMDFLQVENLINLILCAFIVVFGYLSYQKGKKMLALAVAVAFGLFGISHFLSLVGLSVEYPWVIIIMRIIAYILVLFALYQTSKTSEPKKK